jgi:hypothetical protein
VFCVGPPVLRCTIHALSVQDHRAHRQAKLIEATPPQTNDVPPTKSPQPNEAQPVEARPFASFRRRI